MKGGLLRGERLHERSAERSSSWAIGEAWGHCPLHNHAFCNQNAPAATVPHGEDDDVMRMITEPAFAILLIGDTLKTITVLQINYLG